MNKWELKKAVFDAPIQRVISGPIVVSVRTLFSNGKSEVEVSTAVTVEKDLTDEVIEDAWQRAINTCWKKIDSLTLAPNKVKAKEDFMKTMISSFIKDKEENLYKEQVTKLKEIYTDSEELNKRIQNLHSDANERQQQEVNELMETIGVLPINVRGEDGLESMTLVGAQALIYELKNIAKKWETDVDVSVMK